MKPGFSILWAILVALFFSCSNQPGSLADQVTIYIDKWGIPHIYGETDEAAVFGFAYVRAQDRMKQLETETIKALGRQSELDGIEAIYPEAGGIGNDLMIHAFNYLENARLAYDNAEPKIKGFYKAYADGLNYYLEMHPEHQMQLLEKFEPWMIAALEATVLSGNGLDQTGLNRMPLNQASNSLAINGPMTGNGTSLLMSNPHMDYDHFITYEYHLHSDEGLNIYGTIGNGKGIFPVLGFNEYLGWTLTVNFMPDLGDLYEMKFNHPTDSLQYEFDGGYKKVEVETVTFKVKDGEQVVDKKIDIWNSVYGPIFQAPDSVYYSYSIESGRNVNSVKQAYEMAKSTSLEEFKQAIATNAYTMHNLTYADKDNIFYISNAHVPVRDTLYDWTKPVPGNTSKTLWKGFHKTTELPQVENPKEGFVLNANSSPFVTTFESNPPIANYPSYMYSSTERPLTDNIRSKRMKHAIRNSDSFDFKWIEDLVTDTYAHNFHENALPGITGRWERLNENDPDRADTIREPIELLLSWDAISHKESVETTLFFVATDFFFIKYGKSGSQTPFFDAFEETLHSLENEFGTWQVPWSDIMRHQRREAGMATWNPDKPSYATDGSYRRTGVMWGVHPEENPFTMDIGTLKRRATGGNAYVSLMEFSDEGVRARNILPYGNSLNPDSPHYEDQAEMYANRQLRDVYFKLEDIKANLEVEYKPGEEVEN